MRISWFLIAGANLALALPGQSTAAVVERSGVAEDVAAGNLAIRSPQFSKRANLDGCAQELDRGKVKEGLSTCATLASAAARAAANPRYRTFEEYFRTNDRNTRDYVKRRFEAIASECSKTGSGVTSLYCVDDPSGFCESDPRIKSK